jgi:16S rRNA (cytidine1402-2'-O)-methyltransferase
MDGTLYIVATPIGNLGDVTTRALATLRMVDVVYAEDTRVTHKLLERYEIKKPLHSYREAAGGPQVIRTIQGVISALQAGKNLAFCSDAGTPGISDPGNYLVKQVVEAGLTVVPIPGASSFTAILSVAGFVAQRPLFVGFLPKKKGHQTLLRKVALALQEELCDSLVFLESPERIVKLLGELSEWGMPIEVCVGREITKLHEEIMHGPLEDVLADLAKRPAIKGEITLAVQLLKK